ncbi:hypothetical protein MTR67_017481 [Solanum verrucosum]|uniref:Uncharacterized protein n=1 Tax=Solanum verrucosum TaxID=315347 RepID=A0AAF0TLJ0_SOLVR|nr:hypothetical protein MTR67_017481 [Solanum verrucosum]
MFYFAMINLESRKKVLLVKLNSKLEVVEKRIEVLNMVNNGHWVIGDVPDPSNPNSIKLPTKTSFSAAFRPSHHQRAHSKVNFRLPEDLIKKSVIQIPSSGEC